MEDMHGIITRVVVDRGFGFIEVPNETDIFFHMSALEGLDFDDVELHGRRVEFERVETPEGKVRAAHVRATN
jgi:cold shock protein